MNNSQGLREIRFYKGLSQYALQAETGVFQSRLSLIERGLVRPTKKEIKAIVMALNVNENEIAWPTMRPFKCNPNRE